MEKKIKIWPPTLPNFVKDEKGTQYDLRKDFSEKELRALLKEWVERMVARLHDTGTY